MILIVNHCNMKKHYPIFHGYYYNGGIKLAKTRKKLIFVGIVFCLFILVNCASASDYYVNKDTTHKNITDWMKKDAKKGDNLRFNTSSYSLSDTLVISKSVNVKSYKNTKIYFNSSKNLFNVTSNDVNFTGLFLYHVPAEKINYSGSYIISAIATSDSIKRLNLKNMNIFANITRLSHVYEDFSDIHLYYRGD